MDADSALGFEVEDREKDIEAALGFWYREELKRSAGVLGDAGVGKEEGGGRGGVRSLCERSRGGSSGIDEDRGGCESRTNDGGGGGVATLCEGGGGGVADIRG